MKQAKKYWAWTARQRGRSYRQSMRQPAPPPDFRRHHWHQHRARTRYVLYLMARGCDEGNLTLLYQPRHSARYDWE
ncbi:MAG: hypothetical protein EOO60_03745 [Hymenobacter sp.]|nr:MAG: hypothetical protein EOO60_03745 [Hymenobacter sp.]